MCKSLTRFGQGKAEIWKEIESERGRKGEEAWKGGREKRGI
jgi:hypothetical protein